MLGNFTYSNPTKLYFGENALDFLPEELNKYGKNIMLCYGGGSIKKNGIYDKVTEILQASGKNVFEDGGIMPNPTHYKLYEGCQIARENKVDLILAVGGGSVCDYAKAPAREERELETLPPKAYPDRDPEELLIRWTTFDEAQWGKWSAIRYLPLVNTVKERYDYAGCNIALSVRQGETTWLTVAKAFGCLGEEKPTAYRLVLGGFEAVRLIPVDAGDPDLRGLDIEWLLHLRGHVPVYAERGFRADNCRYCRALKLWDNPDFRADAIDWLRLKGHTCRRSSSSTSGGNGGNGGTKYAH